ncbi:FAD:protein FMN transferase [Georgfuchsia toluolica]|uniref:FAD:protein FMN transferase n=1 Tax=Georgfuchsia toluolica TaxID=424218 RepID=A0A916J406_9PROT|nr:FAD:protein FMN transferase [Georgfuchsia toluolica]CAG4883578.1 FAD:protein FMN transferase [Georgfuchsia toluolica]
MPVAVSRRRFITFAAAAAGLPLLLKAGRAKAQLAQWEGTALGGPASIQLYHANEAVAQQAIAAALAELRRQEAIFSIYRPDSAISRLNHQGKLDNAPADLMTMLERGLSLAKISDGIYDPTVQPLWNLYSNHFAAANPDPDGPSARELAAALALVDWRQVEVDRASSRIAFARPGMGLTLNAGAQGYITDRVADQLRAHGFDRMLVDMGEPRVFSAKPDGSAWRIGIANPVARTETITSLDVVDRCVSTSGGYGTVLDKAGRFTHIFNTRTGGTAPAMFSVSVVAKSGFAADGLSATMLMAPVDKRQAILKAGGGEQAIFVTPQGVVATVKA